MGWKAAVLDPSVNCVFHDPEVLRYLINRKPARFHSDSSIDRHKVG